MNVNVEFPENFKPILLQRAAAVGQDVAVFIREFATENLVPQTASIRPRKTSHEEFRQRLDAWISLHPRVAHELDVSRESVYEGRGE